MKNPLAALIMQTVAPKPAPAAQAGEIITRTIDYIYDPLYRLTAADYDDGSYFYYRYDAVGNRLSEGTDEGSSAYAYDAANRLVEVDGVAYTWDSNGNLLSDGTSSYSYNHANRLVGVSSEIHISEITSAWRRWQALHPNASMEQVLEFERYIESVYGWTFWTGP